MGSHSVICHPAVHGNIPAFSRTKLRLVLDLATQKECKAELRLVGWLHNKVVYSPEDGHPSKY